MTEFDPSKPVMTRDGYPAKVTCHSLRGTDCFMALVHYPKTDVPLIYEAGGNCWNSESESDLDLLNVDQAEWVRMFDEISAVRHLHELEWRSSVHRLQPAASGEFITTAVEK